MKTDIYQKIENDFGSDLNLAIEQLEILDALTKGAIEDRIIRAMIFLSKGNIDLFKEVIELSRKDYRDVLWQAEYNCTEKRIYDFNKTFHQLNLIHK